MTETFTFDEFFELALRTKIKKTGCTEKEVVQGWSRMMGVIASLWAPEDDGVPNSVPVGDALIILTTVLGKFLKLSFRTWEDADFKHNILIAIFEELEGLSEIGGPRRDD